MREDRAEISEAALIKLALQIYRNNKLKTQERAFEEEGFIFNLHVKRISFRKYKAYPLTFKMTNKREFYVWKPISRATF